MHSICVDSIIEDIDYKFFRKILKMIFSKIFLFLLKTPKINPFHQKGLIYHISLKISIFAIVNYYYCKCSNSTISKGTLSPDTHTLPRLGFVLSYTRSLAFN